MGSLRGEANLVIDNHVHRSAAAKVLEAGHLARLVVHALAGQSSVTVNQQRHRTAHASATQGHRIHGLQMRRVVEHAHVDGPLAQRDTTKVANVADDVASHARHVGGHVALAANLVKQQGRRILQQTAQEIGASLQPA